MTRSDLERDPWQTIEAMVEQHRASDDAENVGPLAKQHAIIIGGDRGIGAAIARQLASMGADISLISNDFNALLAMRERLKVENTGRINDGIADITDPQQVESAIEWASNLLGSPTIIVNAEDLPCTAAFEDMPVSDWQTVLDTNLTGPANVIQSALPHLKENKSGLIINIAAQVALTGGANQSAYAAAKAGLVALGQSLNLELAKDGISVFTLCPAITLTEETELALRQIANQQNISFDDIIKQVARANNQPRLLPVDEITALVSDIILGKQDITKNSVLSLLA